MFSVRPIVMAGALTALVVALVAAFGYAQANGEDVINACYKNNNGAMRYIDPDGPKACKDHETALEWNSEGVQGPPGPSAAFGKDY